MRLLLPFTIVLVLFALALSGCSTDQHARNVNKADDAVGNSGLTVGAVQREIKKGMASGDVVQVLGNPNIVSTDSQGREVWTYDQMKRTVNYSSSSGGVWLILGGTSGNSGSGSTTQTTLTIIVKYDEEGKVRDLAYHSSRF